MLCALGWIWSNKKGISKYICILWEKRCTWIIEKTQCLLQYHQKKSVEDSCALLQFTFTVFSFSSGSRSMLLFGYLLYFSLLCVCFRVFWMDIEANNSGEDKKVFHIHFSLFILKPTSVLIIKQKLLRSDSTSPVIYSRHWINFTSFIGYLSFASARGALKMCSKVSCNGRIDRVRVDVCCDFSSTRTKFKSVARLRFFAAGRACMFSIESEACLLRDVKLIASWEFAM